MPRRNRQATKSDPYPPSLTEFSNGRMLAWYAVQQYDQTGRFLAEILSDCDQSHQLSSQERGLAVDLSSRLIRSRRTLDTLLESQISRPRSNVEPDLWTLLQLGACQLAFLRTPDHAAVDTIVELAKLVGRARWCGFANGVLRNIARLLTDQTTEQPAGDALPLSKNVYRQLTQAVFPNPTTDHTEYVGRAFSLPRSLARRWSGRYSFAELLDVCAYSNSVPVTVLRVNRLRSTVGIVQAALEDKGVEVHPGENDWSLRLSNASQLTSLPGFTEGWWSVQDESAMKASELLAPQAGERILDLCAAPGGKSAHLAELSGDQASVVACDVSESRLNRVAETLDRLQHKSVQPELISRDGGDIPAGPYDAALVDVPCSNSGVLSRRPEARWRFRQDELQELVQLQTRLLLSAFEQLRPGGRIVYSTCSIEPEETTELIQHVAQAVKGLSCERQEVHLPGRPSDGAFQALLVKQT